MSLDLADWFNISDTAVDPDAPVTSELAYAFRDNPVAIAEGAVGSPRIRIGALQRIVAGNSIRSRVDAVVQSDESGPVEGHSFPFCQVGSIRVTYEGQGLGTTRIIRTRNSTGEIIASFSEGASFTLRTSDVSVLPGDLVSISGMANTGQRISLRNMRFSTAGQDLWPGVAIPLEGNTYNS